MALKQITNTRVIAGIFREAILAQIPLRVNDCIDAYLNSIEEQDRRDKDLMRYADLQVAELDSKILASHCELTFIFSNFVVKCSVEIISQNHDIIKIILPTKVVISDLRQSKRIEPKLADIPATTAIIECNGIHYEAMFKLLNISKEGLAGIVDVSNSASIASGSRLIGVINTAAGSIDISGHIIIASDEKRTGDLKAINVRVLRKTKTDDIELHRDPLKTDRRQQDRYPGKFELTLRSILAPLQAIELEVLDASVSGFAAQCKSRLLEDLLVPGVPLKLERSSLIAEVIRCNDGLLRCQWTSGDELDRAIWLKKISKVISNSVAMSLPDAGKLMEVFCSAGAFSSDFVRSQRSKFAPILENMEDSDSGASYIHRWIDFKNKDDITGHISCIRMGDNAWFATDLVKSADNDAKLSDQFVDKFLRSFASYCITLAPMPRMFLIWLQGHPYWQPLEGYLKTFNSPLVDKVSIVYNRLTTIQAANEFTIQINEISSTDFKSIDNFLNNISDLGPQQLAKSFDFDPDRFGSPRLRIAISRDKKVFWRKYLHIVSADFEGLAIITSLPDGMNPNRVIDSAWFFEFKSASIKNEKSWIATTSALKRFSAEKGLSLFGIRRVSDFGSIESFDSDNARMVGYLIHPECLLKFGNIK